MIKKGYKAFVILTMIVVFVMLIAIGILYAVDRIIHYDNTDYEILWREITDEEICSTKNAYTAFKKSFRGSGNPSHMDREYDAELLDHVEVSIDRLDGLLTVSRSLVENKKVSITISSTLKSGELRIFLIKNDVEILKEVFPNEKITLEYISNGTDTYTVKALGLSADMEIEIDRVIS